MSISQKVTELGLSMLDSGIGPFGEPMASVDQASLKQQLQDSGHATLRTSETLDWLAIPDPEDWRQFVRSWGDLGPDLYMADGGRYRRRRHGTFRVAGDLIAPKPHQPHFQSRDYNPLNGDVQRWFMPVADAIQDSPVTKAIMRHCASLFAAASCRPRDQPWHVELHQFRIEASASTKGQPTPEGRHRDGVDWVFVMLVARENISEGVTEISSPDGQPLGRLTLSEFGDSILLDDHRVFHGVTPIVPIDPKMPAYRDALVVTFVADQPTKVL